MGNTNSALHDQIDDGPPEVPTSPGLNRNRNSDGYASDGRSSRGTRRNTQSMRVVARRASTLYESFRRNRSVDSMTSRPNAGHLSPTPSEMEYEHDSRPLVGMGEIDMIHEQPTRASSRPASRRFSTMSRLRSHLVPDSVARGFPGGGEENSQEADTLSHGGTDRLLPTAFERRSLNAESNTRLSLTDSLRRRSLFQTDARRRRIRGPFPALQATHQPLDSNNPLDSFTELHETTSPTLNPPRQRNRFSRVRDSLSLSRLSSLFEPSTDQLQSMSTERESLSRPSRVTFADESDHLLPPQPADPSAQHAVDDAPHELDAVEPEARTLLSGPRVTSGMSTIRRFQPGLRSRSTRLIRRGEHPPLSQVLQLAAAAIAAQLSGHAGSGQGGGRPLGSDTFDGSIQNFVQTLQDAATAQAGENIDINSADGDLPPVNFMRVFQFPNDENGSPIASLAQSRDVDQMDLDSIGGPSENDRSVTLVLVGVRSLPHGQDAANGENGTLGPSLDTLLSLPFLPPANVLRNGSSGALFRRSDGRARTNTRRHSMTNFSFPAQYESQRHQRTRTHANRLSNASEHNVPSTPDNGAAPQLLSESPPGPHPPPSTPADLRSGQTSPIRRPSSASAAHNPTIPETGEDRSQAEVEPTPATPTFNSIRQRRRSDSEFARRPDLGSGAARRNGVVEPDHPSVGAGRSWLIYVVGTNVSPDHPAFAMPSLFTDNPSYEDMQMLSTLLGPVKPPVATQDDVSSAGGLFQLVLHDGRLVGRGSSETGDSPVIVGLGERCLICLSDYVAAEEVRRLDKCNHVYHRECIDEWLTTGRNSCPMCRGEGVREKGSSGVAEPGTAPPTTI